MVKNKSLVGYASPQMIQKCYSNACDCWSCGVICFGMLSGDLPFESPFITEGAIIGRVLASDYNFTSTIWKTVSGNAINLVRGLLTYAETERLTATKVPWIVWGA